MDWSYLKPESTDWIIIVFTIILFIFSFVKTNYSYQTKEFLQLLFNNKYIIIYNKKEKLRFPFLVLFTIVQWLSLSIWGYIFLRVFDISFDFPLPIHYVILGLTAVYLILKLFFQYGIIYIFDMSFFGKNYIFNRLSFSNYAAFVLALLNLLMIYTFSYNKYFFYVSIFIFFYILLFGLYSYIKLHKKLLKPHLFYFILYLCTFEISPYIFIGHLIISK